MDCIFCKIVAREITAKVIYENDEALGILDVHPIARGHTMIIPKIHVSSIFDLPDDRIGSVFQGVKKAAELLDKKLAPEGFTYGINQGEASGQTVSHLHIHIVPRWSSDGGMTFHKIVNNPPQESLDDIFFKITGRRM